VAGPIALLVYFQTQFLPYHDRTVTWFQRCIVVADLMLLWTLWPSIDRGKVTRIAWHDLCCAPASLVRLLHTIWMLPWVAPDNKPVLIAWAVFRRVARRWVVPSSAIASVITLLLVFTVATLPDEWLENHPPPVPFISVNDGQGPRRVSIHELLFVGSVDIDAGKTTSPWSNRLVLPRLDVIGYGKSYDSAKLAAPPPTVSLRERHLERAVLSGAILAACRTQGGFL
jgi:hypothetical protein